MTRCKKALIRSAASRLSDMKDSTWSFDELSQTTMSLHKVPLRPPGVAKSFFDPWLGIRVACTGWICASCSRSFPTAVYIQYIVGTRQRIVRDGEMHLCVELAGILCFCLPEPETVLRVRAFSISYVEIA